MKSVFIIHGHDSLLLKEVSIYFKAKKLQPVILNLEVGHSKTIIEKFEFYAKRCCFAVALLTPDDKQAGKARKGEQFRARQNVLFELGWFCGRLGRKKTVLIYKHGVELPSDLYGVLYLPVKESLFEVAEQLTKQIKASGLL